MKGDFSKWNFEPLDNFNALFHQQGRVLLDRDWNEEVKLTNAWRLTSGKDTFGSKVAAIPAEEPQSFKVTKAEVVNIQKVMLQLITGRAWVDGHLVKLEANPDTEITGTDPKEVKLKADYLPNGNASVGNINDTVRDAVVLEVWQEALNAFQLPKQLLEPALGGPDTTERMLTGMALRLLRLKPGDQCFNLQAKLKDDFSTKGKLKVTLQKTTTTAGDCPVVEGGGYTGFEHNLFRIEIANVNQGVAGPMFKWSRFNGGLVGRGNFDATDPNNKKITITANLQPITTSGLEQMDKFYLEVVEYNTEAGYWQVTYGAEATLNGNKIEIKSEKYVLPTLPVNNIFFRLWDGIDEISKYPKASGGSNPVALGFGIHLEFDTATSDNYRPADYWTFPVRAAGVENPETLIDDKVPQGVHYYRVPLGILHWDADQTITLAEDQIDDCRRVFKPLINQKVCCTFTIGDGVKTQGDYNSIEEALKHLPTDGGCLCLLPGEHKVNLKIEKKKCIHITGCGMHTIVHPDPATPQDPIFTIKNSQMIKIDNLTLISTTGMAIKMESVKQDVLLPLKDIRIVDNHIIALGDAIRICGGEKIQVMHNDIAIYDKTGGGLGIYMQAMHGEIEKNKIIVVPSPEDAEIDEENIPDEVEEIFDDCADTEEAYNQPNTILAIVWYAFGIYWGMNIISPPKYKALGGIQIGSGSEDIKIRENQIIGGRGHGISLGSFPDLTGHELPAWEQKYFYDTLDPEILEIFEQLFESFIYDLEIIGNEIKFMGLNGISVIALFNLNTIGEIISVEDCTIYRNTIQSCVQQYPEDLPPDLNSDYALGGVVLADGENVMIQENRIENNGTTHLQPICGIWSLFVEKIDVSNNRIINNGPRTSLEDEQAQKGWRGGIVLRYSLQKISETLMHIISGENPDAYLYQDSIPAVKVHDNTVVQPLGQALVIVAMGPVSVVNNHLTSQGVLTSDYLALMGGTVLIANLGIAKDLFSMAFMSSFRQMGQINAGYISPLYGGGTTGYGFAANYAASPSIELPAIADFLKRFLYMPSGQILYNDNRITLDMRAPSINYVISSQTLISLDDISFASNYSEIAALIDVAIFNAVFFGFSIRTANNRFQEGITLGISTQGYSLFSYGVMNTTMGNQATNCLLSMGNPLFNLNFGNTVLWYQRCPEMTALLAAFLNLQLKQ